MCRLSVTVCPGYYVKIINKYCAYFFTLFTFPAEECIKSLCAHTRTNMSVVVSLCPIPAVLRCYLSLTCHGCQILMDGKQIGAARETRAPGHKQSSPPHLAIRCVSAATHSCLTDSLPGAEQMVTRRTFTC